MPSSADPIMIRLENILTPGRSLVNVPGGSKKRVLEQIANVVARDLPDLDAQDIFESLIAREKLGSTGFGNGIAIHGTRPEEEWTVDNNYNWTDGCVSVKYTEMKDLFSYIPVGTPVTILP